jgi:tetratricopeptide (TPR) repeat protein
VAHLKTHLLWIPLFLSVAYPHISSADDANADSKSLIELAIMATRNGPAHDRNGVSKSCSDLFENLETSDPENLFKNVASGRLKLDPECQAFEPPEVSDATLVDGSSLKQNLYSKCAVTKFKNMRAKLDCLGLVVLTRLERISSYVAAAPLSGVSTEGIAADLYLPLINPAQLKPRHLSEAEELHQRLPNSSGVLRAYVTTLLYTAGDLTQQENSGKLKRILELLDQGIKLHPEERDLSLYRCMIEAKYATGHLDKLYAKLKKENGMTSKDGSSLFCLSFIAFKKNDQKSSLEYMNRAVSAEPHNENFIKTRDGLRKAKPEDHPFVMTVDLGQVNFAKLEL